MERVTLIYKDLVAKQEKRLDYAEKIANANLHPAAVASAKKQIRNVVGVVGCPTVKNVGPDEIAIYRKYLRDVGENTFVFDEQSLNAAKVEIAKLNGGVK